jgi:hypothetical protein
MEYEFLRENVRVYRLEDCGDPDDCIRRCFEETIVEVKAEDLSRLGWIPRDCVVIVKADGG